MLFHQKYYAESVETTKLAAVGDKLEPTFTAEEKAELAELAAKKEQLVNRGLISSALILQSHGFVGVYHTDHRSRLFSISTVRRY